MGVDAAIDHAEVQQARLLQQRNEDSLNPSIREIVDTIKIEVEKASETFTFDLNRTDRFDEGYLAGYEKGFKECLKMIFNELKDY